HDTPGAYFLQAYSEQLVHPRVEYLPTGSERPANRPAILFLFPPAIQTTVRPRRLLQFPHFILTPRREARISERTTNRQAARAALPQPGMGGAVEPLERADTACYPSRSAALARGRRQISTDTWSPPAGAGVGARRLRMPELLTPEQIARRVA